MVLALTTGILCLEVGTVQANTFVVTSTADQADDNIADGVCHTAGGGCTLRAAIQNANLLPGPHEILLPAGTFYLTIAAVGPDDASTGDLDITQEVTIRGAGRDTTVIDGMGMDRIFHVSVAVALKVTDMTIRNGSGGGGLGGGILHQSPGAAVVLARMRFAQCSSGGGGAVYHGNGGTTIADSIFENNIATGSGGAVFGGPDFLTMTGSSFATNTAGGTGGGVYFSGTTAVTISGTTFVDCHSDAGGAIYVSTNLPLNLTDCRFESSSATGEGGALYASGAAGLSPVLTRCTFISNDANGSGGAVRVMSATAVHLVGCLFEDSRSGVSGGGLYQSGGGSLTLEQCDFVGNEAMGGHGGGLYGSFPGEFAATGCRFIENTAGDHGGGAYITGRSANNVTGCYFADNSASSTNGGGFYDTGGGPANWTNTTFARNRAVDGVGPGQGGGLYSNIGGLLTITACTFSGNEAFGPGARAGGVYMVGPSASLSNTTFSSNVSGFQGGATDGLAGATTITNVTFFENAASGGGAAIWQAGGPLTVQNTIIGHSLAGSSCGGGVITSGGHNIDQDGGCGFAAAGDLSGVDPRLGPLLNNGGPTQTHALLAGSPAVNAGGAGVCPATDQRGLPRTACDIGAFEVVSDCNNNGQDDTAEVVSGATPDCNHNGIPDSCDIASGLSADCDGNGVPDGCQVDSDGNGIIDACEPGPQPASGPCGVCGMGVGTMMPLMLLGMAWIRRRTR